MAGNVELRGARVFGDATKKIFKSIEKGRDPLGVSDQYGLAAFKSSMNTRLPAGALISTVMISLLHGMFPATGRWLTEPVHTFTHIQHTPGPAASMDTTWYSSFLSH